MCMCMKFSAPSYSYFTSREIYSHTIIVAEKLMPVRHVNHLLSMPQANWEMVVLVVLISCVITQHI